MILQKICFKQRVFHILNLGDLLKKTATNYLHLDGLIQAYAVKNIQKVWLDLPNQFLKKNKVML